MPNFMQILLTKAYVLGSMDPEGRARVKWALGFYDGEVRPNEHRLVDTKGQPIGPLFTRIREVKKEFGAWVLGNKKDLEMNNAPLFQLAHEWERNHA